MKVSYLTIQNTECMIRKGVQASWSDITENHRPLEKEVARSQRSYLSRAALMLARSVRLALLLACATAQSDLSPPVVTALSVSTNEVDVSDGPASVSVNVSWVEEYAGSTSGNVAWRSPSGDYSEYAYFFGTSTGGEVLTDTATVTFPQFTESGVWDLLHVYVRDDNNNRAYYYENCEDDYYGCNELGFNVSVAVLVLVNAPTTAPTTAPTPHPTTAPLASSAPTAGTCIPCGRRLARRKLLFGYFNCC